MYTREITSYEVDILLFPLLKKYIIDNLFKNSLTKRQQYKWLDATLREYVSLLRHETLFLQTKIDRFKTVFSF